MTSTRLVLIGIGVQATMSALTMLMIILSPITAASRAYIWLTGSLYGASWENVYTLLPWVTVLIPLAILYARTLNVQVLGDDVAKGGELLFSFTVSCCCSSARRWQARLWLWPERLDLSA